MKVLELSARIREKKGKKVKALLREGKIPAVLYGPGIENLNLEIDEKEFEKILKELKNDSLINLKVGKKEFLVSIKEIQKDPIKEKIIHIDFYKANSKQ
jgi:large subunit ribosomal protein L25